MVEGGGRGGYEMVKELLVDMFSLTFRGRSK